MRRHVAVFIGLALLVGNSLEAWAGGAELGIGNAQENDGGGGVRRGYLTVAVDCGERESVAVANGDDSPRVLRGIGSSEQPGGGIEVALSGMRIESGERRTIVLAEEGAEGEIFEDGTGEIATFYFYRLKFDVPCGADDRGALEIAIGSYDDPEPTPEPNAPEGSPRLPEAGGGAPAGGGVPAGGLATAALAVLGAGSAAVRR